MFETVIEAEAPKPAPAVTVPPFTWPWGLLPVKKVPAASGPQPPPAVTLANGPPKSILVRLYSFDSWLGLTFLNEGYLVEAILVLAVLGAAATLASRRQVEEQASAVWMLAPV